MSIKDDQDKMIPLSEAAAYSFEVAYEVALALLYHTHNNCQGCMVCDVIKAAIEDRVDHRADLS